ncbi:MAG: hypothetical protein IPH18_15755 [Chitinophagaceae bacterium]|nr:hypothetical protein [Chitinophagaceae bacterium]
MNLVSNADVVQKFEADLAPYNSLWRYESAGWRIWLHFISPIREKGGNIRNDEKHLKEVMESSRKPGIVLQPDGTW